MKSKRWLIFFLIFSMILTTLAISVPAEASNLTLTYPRGGQTLYVGNTYNITWDGYPHKEIAIALSTNSGLTYDIPIGSGTGGSYAWTVPDIPTDRARIAIVMWDLFTFKQDTSNTDFTIAKLVLLPPGTLVTLPAAPSNLTISDVFSNSLTLNWVDNSSNETGFKVERKMGEAPWTQIAQVGANVTSYTDTGLTAATTYKYRVRAYNAIGNSAYCPEASATTPISFLPPGQMLTFPKAPTNLVAAEASSTALSLSWVDHATNEAGFRLERREPGEPWAQITEIGANATSYLDTGLSPDTVYDYRVRAYNIIGNSAYSNEASARTMPAPPPPPMGQTVIRLTIGSSRYLVNGSPRNMDVAPMIREGRTLLPIRFVAEPLGAAVGWDAAQQKATVTLGDKEVELWIGQNRARVNGAYQYIDPTNQNVVPIVVPPGRTMLPLRFVAEALGCQVEWNGVTQEVTVIYPVRMITMDK